MSLQAAIEAHLPSLRRAAESRMTSRATIYRPDGTTTDDDGFEVPAWAAVDSDVPFRLGGSSGASGTRTVAVGGVETQVATRVGHLPADFAGLQDNDLILVTDGENVGRVLRVVEATGADQQTALRVPVFEVPVPDGLS